MSVHYMHAWCLKGPEECVGSFETGVKDRCETLCECWELNPDCLEEQPVLLTAETSLQAPY